MAINYREFSSLLKVDIVQYPDKLEKLTDYLHNCSDSALLDALIESNILKTLIVPKIEALKVIGAFVRASSTMKRWSDIDDSVDLDLYAKYLYDLLHVQTDEGRLEDLDHRRALDDIFLSTRFMTDAMADAFAKNNLIEAFYNMDYINGGTCPDKYMDSLFEECKSRYDRAYRGTCSMEPVSDFINAYAFVYRPLEVEHVADLKLETYPLLLSEAIRHILFYEDEEENLSDVLKRWPNLLEEVVDAILDWSNQQGMVYFGCLHVYVDLYFENSIYAQIFSDLGSKRHISLMNLFKNASGGSSYLTALELIFGTLKYSYDRTFGLELIIFPWHKLQRSPQDLVYKMLAGLSQVKTVELAPKYVLVAAGYILKTVLPVLERMYQTKREEGGRECDYIYVEGMVLFFQKAHVALKWYEEKGAFDHEIPGVFPDIFEPGALKSFMLESCEEFARDYYAVYES